MRAIFQSCHGLLLAPTPAPILVFHGAYPRYLPVPLQACAQTRWYSAPHRRYGPRPSELRPGVSTILAAKTKVHKERERKERSTPEERMERQKIRTEKRMRMMELRRVRAEEKLRVRQEKKRLKEAMKVEMAERKAKDAAAREEWRNRARQDREKIKEEKIQVSRSAIEAYWEQLEKMGIPRRENIDVEELHKLKLPRPSHTPPHIYQQSPGKPMGRRVPFSNWKEAFITNTPPLLKGLRQEHPEVYQQLVQQLKELPGMWTDRRKHAPRALLYLIIGGEERTVEAWSSERHGRYRISLFASRVFLRLPGTLRDPPVVAPRFAIGRAKAHIILSIAPPGIVHPYAGIKYTAKTSSISHLHQWLIDHGDWVHRVALRMIGTHPFTHEKYDAFFPVNGSFLKKLYEVIAKVPNQGLIGQLCKTSYEAMMKEIQELPASKRPGIVKN